MSSTPRLLGLDIGSVSVSVVEIDASKNILKRAAAPHHGQIKDSLKDLLSNFHLNRICGIASTRSTPALFKTSRQYDDRVSLITAARHLHRAIGAILFVGGEKFGLIRFDENGNYQNFSANTSCAAGTGSFLDQQAERLHLAGADELSRMALTNKGSLPKIATRCAVFAKTDLAHAQQMGFSLPEICDGLCYGLAKNIIDTLKIDVSTLSPILFTGGVSLNKAVVKHLQAISGKRIITTDTRFYGAYGAALNLLEEFHSVARIQVSSAGDICRPAEKNRSYAHPPLKLTLSEYPDFSCLESYEYTPDKRIARFPVEVDVYCEPSLPDTAVYLGIDIGSTSTKAILIDQEHVVLAGFYTRTAGTPIKATQALFSAMLDMAKKRRHDFRINGVGTTGAGRKFIGKLIGADIVMDEISAHARAAVDIDPRVDTIIEIGGQDAKFTTLRNGQVTFSIMNNVCAAGTGSFIEEQAKRLECPLGDFSARAENVPAPLASDRCTVFMERDLNHYLNEGYAVNELLAATLHSVRDNYLSKVAIEPSIGDVIFFQGATAKNKALVAAFEQRLAKPIAVSRYCHLTGALGSALMLSDQSINRTCFKGLRLSDIQIPTRSEVCELCTNHCKLTIAQVHQKSIAYGFLCGRDYDTKKYVANNCSGFDLLKTRKKAFSFATNQDTNSAITIGIPHALHLVGDMPMWRYFFSLLKINTVTSKQLKTGIQEGKLLVGAEFCAPMAALHGHVNWLLDKSTYVFLPTYLEQRSKQKGQRQQYCYYTQFSSSLATAIGREDEGCRLLTPMVHYLYSSFFTKSVLHQMLKSVSIRPISFLEVSSAYDKSRAFMETCRTALKETAQTAIHEGEVHVVLLGRPYIVLSEAMNKRIPELFSSLGVKAIYQDMLSYTDGDIEPITPLLNEIHWLHAADILKAAEVTAKRPGAYPVLITAFGCSPDSFVIDYFKTIMNSHQKPYLILQLDEHDSRVGYETRVEAAIRSFQNHHGVGHARSSATGLPVQRLSWVKDLDGKTLLLPNWDPLCCKLIAANLQRLGLDARCLEECPSSIRKSLQYNSGQCLPLNIIAREFAEYVETHDLNPAKTALWLAGGQLACNLKLYPYHIKTLLNSYGSGMEHAGVYVGKLSMIDISLSLPINNYFAYMFGGFLRKIGCKIRPYEKNAGDTDRVISRAMDLLTDAFLGNTDKETAIAALVSLFKSIETHNPNVVGQRPQVAIFGDLYVRDNPVMNQDLDHFIEAHGGEALTTPYSEYLKMISKVYRRKWFVEGHYLDAVSSSVLVATFKMKEKIYYKYFEQILNEPEPVYDQSPEEILSPYHIRIENTGEAMDNILKIHYLTKHYPNLSLFIQTSPSFCCPALVTAAMAQNIEHHTGIPVVSITYDGTGGNKNDVIIPYLKYAGHHRQKSRSAFCLGESSSRTVQL